MRPPPPRLSPRSCDWIMMIPEASGTGSGRSSMKDAKLKLKIAEVAPIPKTRDMMATMAKPGLCFSVRNAYRRYWTRVPMSTPSGWAVSSQAAGKNSRPESG